MPIKDPEKRKEAQRRADAKRSQRSRGWACIVYPESAPDGWRDALAEAHIEMLVSPLHDSDVTADGKPKKPHYHVLAMFESPVQAKTAKEAFDRAGVTMPPELVSSIKGYARYLIHLDDHDKHRYDAADVDALGGASWGAVALDEADETDRIIDEIEAFIDEYNVVSLVALARYARAERPEWKRTIRRNTIYLTAYLKSIAWEGSK